MYISRIKITGFRNFKSQEILFNDGINVIIGHNNAGKSNLLKCLALVIDNKTSKRLSISDFNQDITLDELKTTAPKVSINITIRQSVNENPHSEDLATVAEYLTKLESPYEAMLTYEFFLPENEMQKYFTALSDADTLKKAWRIVDQDFIRFYVSKIWGGDSGFQIQADSEGINKFDFQYLDAIRDVERDLFSGKNTLLRDVLHFFMDYDIKSDETKDDEVKEAEIKARKISFSEKSEGLISALKYRMNSGQAQILDYANQTGASSFNNASPNFDGNISEMELYSALKLIIEYQTGITIPATHNGLGYNNLIFMSMLLAKMQVDSDGNYLGSNAKVFPILAIEEPEAHLHPAMQYKFLKFLKENKDVKKKARQIFVTSHSTQITSAVSLDEIICLYTDSGNTNVGYPGRVFNEEDEADKISKGYVQRFLDATKSDMLFSSKVILVEGLAEELLLPSLAKYCNISIEDNHIAIINIGGRYFSHFLKLFDANRNYSINKKIVCITDFDPTRKGKNLKGKFEKCYPFEYNHNTEDFEYKCNSVIPPSGNIKVFMPSEQSGKTFEYELATCNPSLKLLLTDSISNKDELSKLHSLSLEECTEILRASKENERIIESLEACGWIEDDKKSALIAARYLNSVSKGANALEISYLLESNYNKKDGDPTKETFIVPQYINDALEWIK